MVRKILLALTLLSSVSLVSLAREERPLWLRYPAISPDGTKVAFTYQGDLYTVPTSGGDAQRLTSGSAYECHPVWSPDGKQIAFLSRGDIFVTSASTSSLPPGEKLAS